MQRLEEQERETREQLEEQKREREEDRKERDAAKNNGKKLEEVRENNCGLHTFVCLCIIIRWDRDRRGGKWPS